jgi:uncharacterized protein
MAEPPRFDRFYPGRAAVEAYGNGGFRFAGMSHRGSILCLPAGVSAWEVAALADIDAAALAPIIAGADPAGVLLIGAGAKWQPLPPPAAKALTEAGVHFEIMDTGAAARTYNVLLGEERSVAAALVAVD